MVNRVPSLPPYAHVLFLQNHDQIGNRAFGERLTSLAPANALEAAIALQLLCPQIPLLFMGEEVAATHTVPVLYRSPRRTGGRRCAKGAGRSSRGSPNSLIRRSANAFRTRMPSRHLPHPSRAPNPLTASLCISG